MIDELFIVDQATTKRLKIHRFIVDREIKAIISWTVPLHLSHSSTAHLFNSHWFIVDREMIFENYEFMVHWETILYQLTLLHPLHLLCEHIREAFTYFLIFELCQIYTAQCLIVQLKFLINIIISLIITIDNQITLFWSIVKKNVNISWNSSYFLLIFSVRSTLFQYYLRVQDDEESVLEFNEFEVDSKKCRL